MSIDTRAVSFCFSGFWTLGRRFGHWVGILDIYVVKSGHWVGILDIAAMSNELPMSKMPKAERCTSDQTGSSISLPLESKGLVGTFWYPYDWNSTLQIGAVKVAVIIQSF